MTIQHKHVSVNLAAFGSAKFIGGLQGLSNTATVILFRMLVLNEKVRPSSDPGKELIRADIVAPYGQLRRWVAEHMGEAIEVLLQESGADLLPQPVPTTMADLGHRLVKGKSKASKLVRDAERVMRETAFTADRKVLALALCSPDLSKEDRLAAAVLNSEHMVSDTFYFPVSYDYRGRMYYRGGIITPQGSDFLKGVLMFAEKAPIGKHGRFAMVQALADAAGFKGTKAEALVWAVVADLREIANGSEGYQAAGLACELIALEQFVLDGGIEAEFESGIICHMDATCSGLQIAAAITGHRATAEATNCTARAASDGKADVYGEVADLISATKCELAQYTRKFGRKIVKKAVMTLGYGAGKETLKRSVVSFLEDEGIEWEFDALSEAVFMQSLMARCSATVALKDQLQDFVELQGDAFEWTTHDGFEVYHDKHAGETVEVGAFQMVFDAKWDESVNCTAVAPNFVHSLDAAQMREAVRIIGNKPVACIHDSLGVRAADYVTAARAVRVAFTKIDAKRIASDLLAQQNITLAPMGDYEPAECITSSYFWC